MLPACEANRSGIDYSSPAYAAQLTRPIRVKLAAGGSISVGVERKATVFGSNGEKVSSVGSGKLSFTYSSGKVKFDGKKSKEFTVLSSDGFLLYGGKPFRGKMRVVAKNGALLLLNVVAVDEYLRGVVPAEVPHTWHIEAIKAQAVAARTYAVSRMVKRESEPWDVVATTADQVYLGVNHEKDSTDKAIRETAGEVITFEGAPITAYYHSDAGGYTKQGNAPYLLPVPSPAPESPYSSWQVSYTIPEFRALLDSGGLPGGRVLDIVASYDDYGRCVGLVITTSQASFGITAHAFRKLTGVRTVRSTMFSIALEGGIAWDKEVKVEAWERLYVEGAGDVAHTKIRMSYATNGVRKKELWGTSYALGMRQVPSKITIMGSGFGHGTGMSQWGARHMAEEGKTYREILTHFYTGVEVVGMEGLE